MISEYIKLIHKKSICEYLPNIYNFRKDICESSFYLWITNAIVDLSFTVVDLHFTHTQFWDKLSASPKENR